MDGVHAAEFYGKVGGGVSVGFGVTELVIFIINAMVGTIRSVIVFVHTRHQGSHRNKETCVYTNIINLH